MVTFPPSGVNLRALSAMGIDHEERKDAVRALTTASVGSTSSFTPWIWEAHLALCLQYRKAAGAGTFDMQAE